MSFTAEDLDDALAVSDLAEVLKVSRRTALRILHSGDIEYIRTGIGRGTIRVPRRSLDDYLNRKARVVPPSHVRVIS